MTTQDVVVTSLIVIQVGLFVLTAPKVGRLRLGQRQILEFLFVALCLAAARIAVLFYIQSRTETHRFSEGVFYLTYLLYPELPVMVRLMPLTSYGFYLAFSTTAILLGSLLWAFPLLYFLSSGKEHG